MTGPHPQRHIELPPSSLCLPASYTKQSPFTLPLSLPPVTLPLTLPFPPPPLPHSFIILFTMYSLLIIHTCHPVSFTLNPHASPYSLALQGAKCVVAGVLLFGVVPLLLGLLCDLIVFTPLRVPLDRTPVYFLSTVRTACH